MAGGETALEPLNLRLLRLKRRTLNAEHHTLKSKHLGTTQRKGSELDVQG